MIICTSSIPGGKRFRGLTVVRSENFDLLPPLRAVRHGEPADEEFAFKTLVSLSLRLKDLLGNVTRVREREFGVQRGHVCRRLTVLSFWRHVNKHRTNEW